VVKEEAAFHPFPPAAASINTASGNHRMNMRMETKPSAIGMQYHGRTYLGTKMLRIQPECPQGADSAGKHKIIDDSLVVVRKCSQLSRQGKRHHEIQHRQELALLLVYPLACNMVLALRAMPIAARQRTPFCMIAIRAFYIQLA
jgi:hypothetical protein